MVKRNEEDAQVHQLVAVSELDLSHLCPRRFEKELSQTVPRLAGLSEQGNLKSSPRHRET